MRAPSLSCLALAFALPLGCSAPEEPGVYSRGIIGGTPDTGDESVVLVFSQTPGSKTGSLCSGSVISPHVVLSAAHCVSPDFVGAGAQFSVFPGFDANVATASDFFPVKEAHFHPDFSPTNFVQGSDISVLVMQDALAQTPLPMNQTALSQPMIGQAARLVGYGQDNGDQDLGGATVGTRREVASVMGAFSDKQVHFGAPGANTCDGDSGGPAFMTLDGREVIVGLVSFGDRTCEMPTIDTRVDAFLSWVLPFVTAADPGFDPSNPSAKKSGGCALAPNPSGGTAPLLALVLFGWLARRRMLRS